MSNSEPIWKSSLTLPNWQSMSGMGLRSPAGVST